LNYTKFIENIQGIFFRSFGIKITNFDL
jgi:hypothetical protein